MGLVRKAAKLLGKLILGAELALLTGCAGAGRRAAQADRVQLDVPFYAGASDRGGPSTLAEILSFWDQPTEPAQLQEEAKSGAPADLLLAAHERGMQARSFQATAQDVREELKLGHPILAYLGLGPRFFTGERYVVITGFDDARGGFFVHAKSEANRFVAYGSFMSKW
jgi:hypothetical protein